MKFSLVIATPGRSMEIKRQFNSLANQIYQNIEVIVADQNEDGRATKRVDRYRVWTCATSCTILLDREGAGLAERFGGSLGVGSGSRWGAGEEMNYQLKGGSGGAPVEYDPALAGLRFAFGRARYHRIATTQRYLGWQDSITARGELA